MISREDSLANKALTEKLTMDERVELREEFVKNRTQNNNIQESVNKALNTTDNLNMPRHRTNCPRFSECPIDYKCMSYNPTFHECRSCILHDTDDVCQKKELHNEKTFNWLITRERIEVKGRGS